MALYQPTNIAPSSLNGTGVIDATQDLTVSWQINGYGGMVGWQIQIMRNDAESTLVYDSTMLHKEKISPEDGLVRYETIYGKNESGDDVPFRYTIPAADLAGKVVNGYENGYKLRINQQYAERNGGTIRYVTVTQTAPVVFMAEAGWEWLQTWETEQTVREPTFIAYKSGNAPALWHRWRLAGADTEEVLYDSGRIYTDNIPTYSTKTLVNGGTYHIRLDGQDTLGAAADTGWFEFTVNYTLNSNPHIQCKAYYVAGMPCTYVTLEADSDANRIGLFAFYGWGVYRVKTGSELMEQAAIIPNGQYSFYDFGIKNNTEYTYEVFSNHIGNGAYHYVSNKVKMTQYWNWSLVETVERKYAFDFDGIAYSSNITSIYNTMYHVTKVYQFQGNVKSGNVSNDNSPFVGENFTGYPIVQKSSRKGLSGTLKGMTGLVKNAEYKDSIATVDDLQSLSSSETVKFLRDRKGNFRRVEIDAPIIKSVSDENAEQAVEIQLPWVETGDAAECQVVSTLDDGLLTEMNDLTVGTAMYIYSGPLSPGVYKWRASGTSGGTVTITAVRNSDPNDSAVVAEIDAETLSGTFTLEWVGTLYAAASGGTITVSELVLNKTAEYTPDTPVTPGQIDIPTYGYGTKIDVLEPGSSYDWEYTSADFEAGATVKLRLVQQVGDTVTQTDKAVIESGALSGTFTTVGDADAATLWLVTNTSDPVTVNGWSLTRTGGGGGDEPDVRSSDTHYLLGANLGAGTWQYTLNDVAYTNPISGQVLTVADGSAVSAFDIGNSASGSFTCTEPVNLYISNPSGTEFTIGTYLLTQTAGPVDPDEGIVYRQDLTVQGNVLYDGTNLSSGFTLDADSWSSDGMANSVYLTYILSDGKGVSYGVNCNDIVSGYSGTQTRHISMSYSNAYQDKPITFTNLVMTANGTTVFSAPTFTPARASLLSEPLGAGSYTIYGTSTTGAAWVTFWSSWGKSQTVSLTATNITTPQTITFSYPVNQIFVQCIYLEECTITGLTIIKNS